MSHGTEHSADAQSIGFEPEDWIGRTEARDSRVTGWQADVMAATLDRDVPVYRAGMPIPPGWHWLYFPEAVRLSEVGEDGHPRKGGFMPPVSLPRRMWAENNMRFHKPLHVGERVRRVSTVTGVTPKQGASGTLCFINVRHEIAGEDGPATSEEHTLVYRDAPGAKPSAARRAGAPCEPCWSRPVQPSPVLLFRFSALTMNSHRIHYDQSYAASEGYPGLVFHGPLTMLFLMALFAEEMPSAELRAFSVRATAPLYATHAFSIHGALHDDGHTAKLWALTHTGNLAMSGNARYD